MKCPHCFLELIIASKDDKEIDKCPKCEGIWLGIDNSENIFDFTDNGDKEMQQDKDLQDTEDGNQDNKLGNDYYYYKRPFKENEKLDDMFDFE